MAWSYPRLTLCTKQMCQCRLSNDDSTEVTTDYPVRWDWVHNEYWKDTLHVLLRVEQDQQGYWAAYRDDHPLLRDGKPARFATCTEAQRAADAHKPDLFPNAKAINDGLSWLPDPEIDWRLVQHRVEDVLTGNGVRLVCCLDLAGTRTRLGGCFVNHPSGTNRPEEYDFDWNMKKAAQRPPFLLIQTKPL